MSSSRSAASGCAYRKARAAREFLRRAPADQIAHQRERPAREADQRRAARDVGPNQPHGFHDEWHVPFGNERRQRIDLRESADRLAHDRARREFESDAHALQWRHDVAEEDGRIELEAPQRLHGHFRGELGAAGERRKIDLRAQLAIFRQIAARLAHDPHGSMRHRLAALHAARKADVGGAVQLRSHRATSGAK